MESGELSEVWQDGGRVGVQRREERRKGKAEQEWGEIKRRREAAGPEIGHNRRLKGDRGREAKGFVAP